MSDTLYRLVTRSDFDGLVCAVLLKEMDMIDDILFVHPKDMQDGIIDITDRDIITNLPFVDGCYMAFDHHLSETVRAGETKRDNHIINPYSPSAARVLYDHYGGKEKFPNITDDLMDAVDKADSAQYSKREILFPTDWSLLNFLMDSRTGLGRFRDFTISNYDLMMKLIDLVREHSIEDILLMPDVKERIDLYFEQEDKFISQVERCATTYDNLVVLDLRDETIWAGNRFMIYALYPQCNISINVIPGKQNQNTVFAVGKSILDRSSNTNVGNLCLKYGGGGHKAAGTCQVDNPDAERVLQELIDQIVKDG